MNLLQEVIKPLIKNPATLWIRWYFRTVRLLWKHKDKKLKVGYLTELFNVKIGKYNTLYSNIIISNSTLGDYVYIADEARIGSATVGNFCSIGQKVRIVVGMHPTHLISTFPAFFSTKKQCQVTFVKKNYFNEVGQVEIGNDVWIGYKATIMDNITIGDGAIIAAGAVVTRDVEPYTIVGGVPARVLKKRFTDEEIEKLLELKWWNKDEHWLKENAHLFNSKQDFFSNLIP